jgi:hypothetical protein
MRRKTNVHRGYSQSTVKKVKQGSTVTDKAACGAMQPAHRCRKALIVLPSLIVSANPMTLYPVTAVRVPRVAAAHGDCGG